MLHYAQVFEVYALRSHDTELFVGLLPCFPLCLITRLMTCGAQSNEFEQLESLCCLHFIRNMYYHGLRRFIQHSTNSALNNGKTLMKFTRNDLKHRKTCYYRIFGETITFVAKYNW